MSLKSFNPDPVTDTQIRLQHITNQKIPVHHISSSSPDLITKYYASTENLIGLTHLPLSIVGPLTIHFNNKKIETYIPLSTTEGALVASINRGIKAINQTANIDIHVTNHGITRAPVLNTKNYQAALDIANYCQTHIQKIQEIINSTSQHTKLLKMHHQILGNKLYLRLHFDTDLAMGMNMATIATQSICNHLTEKFECQLIALSSNFCTDKKPNSANPVLGRGRQVSIQTTFNSEILSNTLKTNANSLNKVYHSKIILGSYLAGSLGYNAHIANTAAALFLATGQDIAHIIESSQSIIILEEDQDQIHATLNVPNLIIGLIGGGTTLPTQSEALKIIKHDNNPDQLAAIFGVTMLAGEISLLASIASQTLAQSHQALGRKKT